MPMSRWDKVSNTLKGGFRGAIEGFKAGGPLGALAGVGIGGTSSYLQGGRTQENIAKKNAAANNNMMPNGGTNGNMANVNNIGYSPPNSQIGTYDILTPGQIDRSNWAGNFAQQQLSNGQFDFNPIAENARNRFQQDTAPSVGNGNPGASSYWNSQMAAKRDLETSLASLRSDYGIRQQGLYQDLLKFGQQRQFENFRDKDAKSSSDSDLSGKDIGDGIGLIKDLWGKWKGRKGEDGDVSGDVKSLQSSSPSLNAAAPAKAARPTMPSGSLAAGKYINGSLLSSVGL